MRSRITASNPAARSVALVLDMTWQDRRPRRPFARRARNENAGDDHWQRVDDAGGEGTNGEDVSRVGLAEQLADGSSQPVAGEENASEQAGLAQGLAPVSEPEKKRNKTSTFERSAR